MMVDEQSAGVAGFISYLCCLVKYLLPLLCLLQCLQIICVCNNDAASGVSGKKRLESALRIFRETLVP